MPPPVRDVARAVRVVEGAERVMEIDRAGATPAPGRFSPGRSEPERRDRVAFRGEPGDCARMPDAAQDLAVDERAAEGLARGEFVVLDAWLGPVRAAALRLEVMALVDARQFRAAGVGVTGAWVVAPEVRRDRVCWFDADGEAGVRPGPLVALFLARLDGLVRHLNSTCFLGLRRVECHASCFEPGAFYGAHTDAFRGEVGRVISYCYYLNDAWISTSGGCLRLHGVTAIDVAPLLDRLVLFRSADQSHEVLPTSARRLSLTGWLSSRPASQR
jgi:SM-20-related protein